MTDHSRDCRQRILQHKHTNRGAQHQIWMTAEVGERDVATIDRFARDMAPCEAFCLCRDPRPKRIGQTRCLPWDQGIRELGL